MKITKYDLFKSALKIRLNDCVDFVIESEKLHNSKIDIIEDELSESFYKELNAIEFSLNFGIINTYSLFDFFLSAYCKMLQEYSQNNLSTFNGKNENIKRAKYIYSVTKFDIRKHKSWQNIENYRKIRNLLIHNNLNIYSKKIELKTNPDKSTKDLIQLVSENPYLDLDSESGKIFIEDVKYIVEFKTIIIELFEELVINIKSEKL